MDMKIIYTKKRQEILVDDEDYETLNKYSWYIQTNGYVRHDTKNKKVRLMLTMHRLVMKAKKGQFVDHINLNKLDNRKSNLRFCTSSQNSIHIPKSRKTKSGFKGVFWYPNNCKSRPWQVGIGVKRKYLYIGNYATVEEAALAYNEAALKYHGKFAYLNSIPAMMSVDVQSFKNVVGSNGTS